MRDVFHQNVKFGSFIRSGMTGGTFWAFCHPEAGLVTVKANEKTTHLQICSGVMCTLLPSVVMSRALTLSFLQGCYWFPWRWLLGPGQKRSLLT